VSFGEQMMT